MQTPEPTSMQIRNTLRQTFRERRKNLSNYEQNAAAEKLISIVAAHVKLKCGLNIALYKTNDGELNTDPLIQYCWEKGVNVYLPILHPFSAGYLLFLRYQSDSAMRANLYGILEPCLDITKVCPINSLDYIFAPLVAFDAAGNRLGMGGGFYDRSLQSVMSNQNRRPEVIGLAHDIQKTLSLPTQAWDIPLPRIMTPSHCYNF